MINKLQALLFPNRENQGQLKILLMHQNLNLTEEQRVLLIESVQAAVENFILGEQRQQKNPLELIVETPNKTEEKTA